MLIHACLHLDKHFVTSHVQFTSFNDLVNLLRGIDDRQQMVAQRTFRYVGTTDDGNNDDRQQTTDDRERIKSVEIENFWERFEAKCIKYKFADTVFRYLVMVRHYYGAPTNGTATHLLHLKALKNPVDFLRYVKGVVFPGKEFMVSKYLQTTDNGQQTTENTSSHHHIITSKFWWLWYPYRWAMGLKGIWLVVTRKTEEKKTSPHPS